MNVPPFMREDGQEWTEGLGGRHYRLERLEAVPVGEVLVARYRTTDREHPPRSRSEECRHGHYSVVVPLQRAAQVWVVRRGEEGVETEVLPAPEAEGRWEPLAMADAVMEQEWNRWLEDLAYQRAMRADHAREWRGE